MLKQEIICPNCDEQFIILSVNQETRFCTFCGDPVESEDQRGKLYMGDEDE